MWQGTEAIPWSRAGNRMDFDNSHMSLEKNNKALSQTLAPLGSLGKTSRISLNQKNPAKLFPDS